MIVSILRYALHPNFSCILEMRMTYCCATATETQLYASVVPPSEVGRTHPLVVVLNAGAVVFADVLYLLLCISQ